MTFGIYLYMPRTDKEIWQDILDGRETAWKNLVEKYKALIYTICLRAGLSMSDAADCFQHTWVSLYENRTRITDPSRLSAWLVTTTKREALRIRRRAAAMVDMEEDVQYADKAMLPDELLEGLERQSLLENALKEIDPRCQKLLAEFFFAPEEKSYEEIAAILGINPSSLGPIRRRCLERLKNKLIESGFPDVRKVEDEAL